MTAPTNHSMAAEDAPTLVGREREQATLRDHLTAMRTGRGSLVLIGGEAGIGKTALVEALIHDAEGRGVRVLTGRCYDLTETPPYGPWIELFAHYQPTDGGPLGSIPPLPAAFAARGTVGEVTSAAALFHQVQDFLGAVATKQPLIVFLDDLHWADPASLDLLRFLSRGRSIQPLLIIATYRTDELTRRHPLYALLPLLVREASATRLDLHPLRQDDLAALVTRRYRLADAETTRLVAYLHERSEGNPFFLGELLRTLEEAGALSADTTGWRLADLGQIRVPALLRQVIDGRLARLGEEAQRLLTIAAVIGQELSLALWTTVAETDEQTVMAAVERAVDAHLLDETPDGTRARFVHALIREALYESVIPSRRRMQHRQVAEALSILPDPDPDAVAYHFQQAVDDRAAGWLVKAGDRAQHAHALSTATDRYEAACALMESTKASDQRRGWILYRLAVLRRVDPIPGLTYLEEAAQLAAATGDRALAASTLFLRAFTRANQLTTQEVLPALAAGVAALEALSREEHARLNEEDGVPISDDSKPWRGSLIFHLALVGQYAEAIAMAEPFLNQNAPTAGGVLRGFAYGGCYLGLAIAYAMLGHPNQAHEAFSNARSTYRSAASYSNLSQSIQLDLSLTTLPYYADHAAARHDLAREGAQVPEQNSRFHDLFARLYHLPLMSIEGDWTQARTLAQEALRYEHGAMRRISNQVLGTLLRHQGESGAAWAHVHEELPAGSTTVPGNARHDIALAMQQLAAALALDDDDLPTAHAWLDAHDRWMAWSGAVLGQSEGQVLWARYYRAVGGAEQAREHAQRALAHATEPRQPLALLAAHRLLGELDTDAGRFDDAESHLNASLALADACQAPYERALTLLALAELHAATNQRTEALALLEEVRAICAPLGAKPTLARADALTARLTSAPTLPAAYPDGLSAREVDVLRLIATGLSNQEIADTLSLSVRTVERHITNLYGKIAARGRADATAYTLRHLS